VSRAANDTAELTVRESVRHYPNPVRVAGKLRSTVDRLALDVSAAVTDAMAVGLLLRAGNW
jgi:hypothetical protein